jgi:hypothetical protein
MLLARFENCNGLIFPVNISSCAPCI